MSRTSIITFNSGLPDGEIEYLNAWGGFSYIWDCLFNKYLKDPNIPYDTWMCRSPKPLFDLVDDERLSINERVVHASTLDYAYVSNKNFNRFTDDLRKFMETYPTKGICHLPAWADTIDNLECEAVGFWGNSVCDNPWVGFDREKDEFVYTPLTKGWEVYEELGL